MFRGVATRAGARPHTAWAPQRLLLAGLVLLAVQAGPSPTRAAQARHAVSRSTLPAGLGGFELAWLDPHRPLTGTAWVAHHLLENHKVSIDPRGLATVLERFQRPWLSGLPDAGWFERGKFGPSSWQSHPPLSWNENACDQYELPARAWAQTNYAPPLAGGFTRPESTRLMHAWLSMSSAPEPEVLELTTTHACPAKASPLVTVIRTGGEYDRFRLIECDGSVSSDAIDRLSLLMRPPGVPRPELPLPAEPPAHSHGEWLEGIKLAHPRLLWALAKITHAFPGRAITILSGYRRDGHGYHPRGRAVDIQVHAIDNTALFAVCRTLNDVGCGFYPNNKFVHLDVREYGSKHPQWVDLAAPGAPSEYVEVWPGAAPQEVLSSTMGTLAP